MSGQIQIATVEGRILRYLDTGEPGGTNVLVLAHAFPVGARLFDAQTAAFPAWRVIAPALPGFDGSEMLDGPSIDAYARHVLRLLDLLGVERFVVGGVSMGGHFTFAMLRQAEERVRAIVLADTRSDADTDETRTMRKALLRKALDEGAGAVADEMVPRLIGATTEQSRPDVVATVRRLIEAQTPGGIAAAIEVLMSRPDSTPMLGNIQVPAMVVAGEEDRVTPVPVMQAMAAAIPGATFVSIPGAGHLANLEDPAAFNTVLQAFLEAVRVRT